MNDGELDELIRRAAMAEQLEVERVERAVRRDLKPRRWFWCAAASSAAVSAIAAAVLLSVWLTRIPREVRDAARDHQIEVIQHRPRHWTTTPADLGAIANQNRIVVPAGYRLKEAKHCGIAGQRVTHLVYTDGMRDISVYLTGRVSHADVRIESQQVRAFHSTHLNGLIVGPPTECSQFVDSIQRST